MKKFFKYFDEKFYFALALGIILGVMINERNNCSQMNKDYDWDSGQCRSRDNE